MNLKTMSIDKLSRMRAQVEAALAAKVADERRTLESELAKLSRLGDDNLRGRAGRRAGGKVAPKYRNPDNPGETWAGRGLKPRWLVAALKTGKKLEHFTIGAAGKKTAPKARKKQGKPARRGRPKKVRVSRSAMRPRQPQSTNAADTAQS